MSKHTPIPWRIHKLPSGELEILSINSRCILNMYDWGNEHQDAQFIVTACNNYERIKAENERLIRALESILEHRPSASSENLLARRSYRIAWNTLRELEESCKEK